MQIEKDYFHYFNEFVQIQDFAKLFWKFVYALLVFKILNNNEHL